METYEDPSQAKDPAKDPFCLQAKDYALTKLIFKCGTYEDFVHTKIPETVQRQVQEMTIKQSLQNEWFQQRQFRLSASKCWDYLSRMKNIGEKKLAVELFRNWWTGWMMEEANGPQKKQVYAKQLQYGLKKEPEARRAVPDMLNKAHVASGWWRECDTGWRREYHVDEAGVFLSEDLSLAASPDGIVKVLDENGNCVDKMWLEIKCPWTVRDLKGDTVAYEHWTKHIAYLQQDGANRVKLNWEKSRQGRQYYHQIQMGMHISGLSKALFVIYSDHAMLSWIVPRDEAWYENYGKKLKSLWLEIAQHLFNAVHLKILPPPIRKKKPRRPPPPLPRPRPSLPPWLGRKVSIKREERGVFR